MIQLFNTKKSLFETYTSYNFYFEYIHDIFAMYITYTLKIYDIVIQYKEFFFEKYTTHSLYFKDI